MPLYESECIRTSAEIAQVMTWVMEGINSGKTHYRGMSYEDGLRAMYEWLTDPEADNPAEEE